MEIKTTKMTTEMTNQMNQRQLTALAQKLPLSAALLVASAQHKGINVHLWLNGLTAEHKMLAHDFASKFISLELISGIHETPFQDKTDFSEATSKSSILSIVQLCGHTILPDGLFQYIDVPLFLQLCEIRVALYNTSHVQLQPQPLPSDAVSTTQKTSSSTKTTVNAPSRVGKQRNRLPSTVFDTNKPQSSSLKSGQSIPQSLSRPSSAQSTESTKNKTNAKEAQFLAPVTSLPVSHSPKICDSTSPRPQDDRKGTALLPHLTDQLAPPAQQTELAPNHRPTNTQDEKKSLGDLIRNQPVSASSSPRSNISAPASSSSTRVATDIKPSTSDGRPSSSSVQHNQKPHKTSNPAVSLDSENMPPSERLTSLKAFVESSLFQACSQADLYHVLQVSFGFVDNVTIVPPRGAIVEARPRPWISRRELLDGFTLARLRFSEIHVIVLVKLLEDFASVYTNKKRTASRTRKVVLSRNAPVKPAIYLEDGSVNSVWLNRYLTSLRLAKFTPTYAAGICTEPLSSSAINAVPSQVRSDTADRSISAIQTSFVSGTSQSPANIPTHLNLSASLSDMVGWKEWNRSKKKYTRSHKFDQFQAALTGAKSDLSQEDTDEMLNKYSILPIELLQQEAELQVKLWRHDIDGRKDFSHQVHKEINKWEAETKTKWSTLHHDTRSSTLTKIKKRVLSEKFDLLLASEKLSLQITKALFNEYRTYCKNMRYLNCVSWGDWLKRHMATAKTKLRKAVDNKKRSIEQERKLKQKQLMVTSLVEIEEKLSELSTQVKPSEGQLVTQLSMELRKDSLSSTGRSQSPLVTSLQFDHYLNKYNLDASDKSVYRASVDSAFSESADEAFQRQLQIEQQRHSRDEREFKNWLAKKTLE